MLLGQVYSRYPGGMGQDQDITKGNAFFSYRYRGQLYSIILIRKKLGASYELLYFRPSFWSQERVEL